jgi:serine/threonine-protein kinase
VNPDVPRALGDLALVALAKEPDQRFQNAREFRVALEDITGKKDPSPAVAAVVAAALVPRQPEQQETVVASALSSAPRVTTMAPAVLEPASVFGNSFVSKLVISFAVGALTFLVGTAAVYAYMTMATH